MKFFITRTSVRGYNEIKPIERAYKEENFWCIDVENLKELVDLSNEFGELIITENSIEIYDDYRE